MKKVSVIIPFYSNIKWLEEALNSVFGQTYTHLEVIVVNDGSAEDVSALIATYAPPIQYYYKSNGGPATARNVGIGYATGDYIAFLDSDDIWEPSKIGKQIDFLNAHPEVSWCHTTYIKFFDDNSVEPVSAGRFKGGELFRLYLLSCPIATPCVLLRADILKQNKHLRFEEGTRYGEDTIFWFKLLAKFELGYIDEPLVQVRLRGQNAAVQSDVQLFARNQIFLHMVQHRGSINGRQVPSLIKFYYRIAHWGFVVYQFTGSRRAWANIFYLPSWILFKITHLLLK